MSSRVAVSAAKNKGRKAEIRRATRCRAHDSRSARHGNRGGQSSRRGWACNMTQAVAVLSAIPRLSYHLRSRLPNLRVTDVLPGKGAPYAHATTQPRPGTRYLCSPKSFRVPPLTPSRRARVEFPLPLARPSTLSREGARAPRRESLTPARFGARSENGAVRRRNLIDGGRAKARFLVIFKILA